VNNSELFLPDVPERLGISSSAILKFINRLESEQLCMHGFMLVRKGKTAAEGYWAPYNKSSMHRMYSVSKSFVSLAIGLMADEGKISLNDYAVNYFKDKAPENIHPYLAKTTIRDLLMMATPHSATSYTRLDRDWAYTFFNKKPSHPPGTIFSYDTSATVILNTIIERVSGVPFLEYMRDKLLDPVGFSKNAWCIRTPEGTSWGGSGVICTLTDMAKLAYVCMNRGCWGDMRLISEEYISNMTSKQIDNSIIGADGYGYQIWIVKDKGFSFRGMGSQIAICFPDKDFLFACTADTQGTACADKVIIDSLREEILCEIKDYSLPRDDESCEALEERIRNLRIIPQKGTKTSPLAEEINGKWYKLHDNRMKLSRTRLIFKKGEGIWEYENASGVHRLKFGLGKMLEESFPETKYFGDQIGTSAGRGYGCLSSASWVEEHKLNMLVYITDIHLGSLKITFSFRDNGDEISIFMIKAAEWFLDEYSGFAGGIRE
jgi:CubicO group peptidase (beta-lactamase class C family)